MDDPYLPKPTNPTKRYSQSGMSGIGGASLSHVLDGKPWFTYFDIPRMQREPYINFLRAIWISPLQKATWSIRATTPEVANDADQFMRKFWTKSMPSIMRRYFFYGYAPGGVEYLVKRKWKLDTIRAVEPRDARVLRFGSGPQQGEFAGFTTASTGNVLAPYAFWFKGRGEFSRFYDQPPAASLFDAWTEYGTRGGARSMRQSFMRKHSVKPAVMYYNPGEQQWIDPRTGEVNSIDNKTHALSTLEYYEAGSNIVIPMEYDANGNPLWRLDPATMNGDAESVSRYPDKLKEEMGEAIGIPSEVIHAAETGSGFSGRSIPYMAWLGVMDEYAGLLGDSVDAVLRQMLRVNYGKKADFEITFNSLVKDFEKQNAKNDAAGGSPNTADAGKVPTPSAQPSADGRTPYEGPRGGKGWKDSEGKPHYGEFNMGQSGNVAPETVDGAAKEENRKHRDAAHAAMLVMFELQEQANDEGDPHKYQVAMDELAAMARDRREMDAVGRGEQSFDMGWEPYDGPKGGKGYKNTETGRIRYQASRPGEHRERQQANAKRASELIHKVRYGEGPEVHEHLAALVDHLPAMSVEKLRYARMMLGAKFEGAKNAGEMREALKKHALAVQESGKLKGEANTLQNLKDQEAEFEERKRKSMADELAFAIRDAATPAVADALHALMPVTGAVPSTKVGDIVDFHAGHHDEDAGTLMPGQKAKVVRPGYHFLGMSRGTTEHVLQSKVVRHGDSAPDLSFMRDEPLTAPLPVDNASPIADAIHSPTEPTHAEERIERSGRSTDAFEGRNPDRGDAGADGGSRSEQAPFKPGIRLVRGEHTASADASALHESVIPHLGEEQRHGAALAVQAMTKHGGFVNQDGTGVGKTRQQLAVAQTFAAQGKKVLIIAPKGVLKSDFKKGTFGGSFKDDSATMGVSPKLNDGTQAIGAGEIHLTTYDALAKIKGKVDGNTVVLLDEAHNLKNDKSARSKHGKEITDAAHSVGYYTATPGDKALHIGYMHRAGIYGTAGRTKTLEKLGMEIHDQHIGGGKYTKVWRVKPGLKKEEVARRLDGLFTQATKDGLMIRRELGMEGVKFSSDHVQLAPEQHSEMQQVFKDVMDKSSGNKAVALMAARMHQEHMKIPHTVEQIKRDLEAGRQPVVFAGRVNAVGDDEEDDDNEVKDALAKSGHSSVGTIPALKAALIAAGVPESDIAELHGEAKEKPEKAMGRFQDGKAKIMLATIQSGGTGINLDDRTGAAPRSVHIMTPPFSANDMAQAIGRVHRMTTRSASNVHAVLSNSEIDKWNAGLLHEKFRTQGAMTSGSVSDASGQLLGDFGVHGHPQEDQKPYEWGQSLHDTRAFHNVEKWNNEKAEAAGGTRYNHPKLGWTTAFPNREALDKYHESLKKPAAPAIPAMQPEIRKPEADSTPLAHKATFTKLKSGDWGIRAEGRLEPGQTITVHLKSGGTKQAKVKRMVWNGNGVWLAEIH